MLKGPLLRIFLRRHMKIARQLSEFTVHFDLRMNSYYQGVIVLVFNSENVAQILHGATRTSIYINCNNMSSSQVEASTHTGL